MKPVQDDMWAERNNIQIGEAVDDSEDGEPEGSAMPAQQ